MILSLVTDIKDRARGQVKAYPIEDAQAGETKGAKGHVVTQPLWNRCLPFMSRYGFRAGYERHIIYDAMAIKYLLVGETLILERLGRGSM